MNPVGIIFACYPDFRKPTAQFSSVWLTQKLHAFA